MPRKPRAIRWLEEQTGQTIDHPASSAVATDHQPVVRLPAATAALLEQPAVDRGAPLEQLLHDLLTATVEHQEDLDARDRQPNAADPNGTNEHEGEGDPSWQ